jgi:hypothetical protein
MKEIELRRENAYLMPTLSATELIKVFVNHHKHRRWNSDPAKTRRAWYHGTCSVADRPQPEI